MTKPAGQSLCHASQSMTATMPALAKLFPKTSVARRSCGAESRRLMILPAPGKRSSNWRTCHLPREKRDVSASAKKKLAPENTISAAHARIGVIRWTKSIARAAWYPYPSRLTSRKGGAVA